jgi:phosphopantothenoylcysteine decarboxylase
MTQTAAFDSSLYLNDSKAHCLLAASGSVATIKLPPVIQALSFYSTRLSIRIILTSSAARFLAGQSSEQPSLDELSRMPNVDGIYLDADEWAIPWTRGAKILHIELRRWADLLVIAPLSANTLAKMAAGFCGNLLMSTIRAWDASGILDPPRNGIPMSGKKKILVAQL